MSTVTRTPQAAFKGTAANYYREEDLLNKQVVLTRDADMTGRVAALKAALDMSDGPFIIQE